METKKIVADSIAWICDPMASRDCNARIESNGVEVLFDDNTREYFTTDGVESFEEAKEFFSKYCGYVFECTEVTIFKGRKIPVGTKKIVEKSLRKNVRKGGET